MLNTLRAEYLIGQSQARYRVCRGVLSCRMQCACILSLKPRRVLAFTEIERHKIEWGRAVMRLIRCRNEGIHSQILVFGNIFGCIGLQKSYKNLLWRTWTNYFVPMMEYTWIALETVSIIFVITRSVFITLVPYFNVYFSQTLFVRRRLFLLLMI